MYGKRDKRQETRVEWVVWMAISVSACTSGNHSALSPADAGSPASQDAASGSAGDANAASNNDAPGPAPEETDASKAADGGAPNSGVEAGSDGASHEAEAGTPASTADSAAGSACGESGIIVCDDFESAKAGGPPAAPWTVATTVGSVAIDTTQAFSGKQSVKVTAPAATGSRSTMLRLTGKLLPPPGNAYYGRMMFLLDSAPATSVHWTFIDSSGLVPGMNYHAVYRYGGQLPITASDGGFGGSQMMASYDTVDSYSGVGPSSDCYHHSKARAVPVGTWSCAQWKFDGPNNTLEFSLDGAPADDLTVTSTGDGCVNQPATYVWTAPSFTQIDLGWESYQADDARTIWIDDVAIGTQSVPCP